MADTLDENANIVQKSNGAILIDEEGRLIDPNDPENKGKGLIQMGLPNANNF